MPFGRAARGGVSPASYESSPAHASRRQPPGGYCISPVCSDSHGDEAPLPLQLPTYAHDIPRHGTDQIGDTFGRSRTAVGESCQYVIRVNCFPVIFAHRITVFRTPARRFKQQDPTSPHNEMAFAAHVEPHRRVERQAFMTVIEPPRFSGARIEVDSVILSTATGTSQHQNARSRPNNQGGVSRSFECVRYLGSTLHHGAKIQSHSDHGAPHAFRTRSANTKA